MSTTSLPLSAIEARPVARAPALSRALVLLYGTVVYAAFLAVFLYAIGFVANAFVPKGIDDGAVLPDALTAVLINMGLLGVFAVQHTIMARPAFKRRWTRIIPAAAERSTFVAITCLILAAMFTWWSPLPDVVWHVEGVGAVALWSLSAAGWALVLVSTFLIDHFELFGLKQVVSHARGVQHRPPVFVEHWLYRMVRHPLMLGFLIAFWATPHMTMGHLLFAGVTTLYIALLGIVVEERDLVAEHGEAYLDYRRRVPKLLPRLRPAA